MILLSVNSDTFLGESVNSILKDIEVSFRNAIIAQYTCYISDQVSEWFSNIWSTPKFQSALSVFFAQHYAIKPEDQAPVLDGLLVRLQEAIVVEENTIKIMPIGVHDKLWSDEFLMRLDLGTPFVQPQAIRYQMLTHFKAIAAKNWAMYTEEYADDIDTILLQSMWGA